MNTTIFENRNTSSDTLVYYQLCCDDIKRDNELVKTDMSFNLIDVDGLKKIVKYLDDYNINYDLSIQEWDVKEEEITQEIFLVRNNYKNQ